MNPIKKLLQRYSRELPHMTQEECDLLVREATEGQLYEAVMSSRPNVEQGNALRARAQELRAKRLPV